MILIIPSVWHRIEKRHGDKIERGITMKRVVFLIILVGLVIFYSLLAFAGVTPVFEEFEYGHDSQGNVVRQQHMSMMAEQEC